MLVYQRVNCNWVGFHQSKKKHIGSGIQLGFNQKKIQSSNKNGYKNSIPSCIIGGVLMIKQYNSTLYHQFKTDTSKSINLMIFGGVLDNPWATGKSIPVLKPSSLRALKPG